MVLDFSYSLSLGLQRIGLIDTVDIFVDSVDFEYGEAKWVIVESIRQLYGERLVASGLRIPDLYNWLFERMDDEVSYFVCEAGANILHHSGLPGAVFKVYFGERGFVISVSQQDSGFDCEIVLRDELKKQHGGGFSFFKSCCGIVFFDDIHAVKTVYYAYFFE